METRSQHESPRQRAVQALIARGLDTVNRSYGPNSPNPKPYHGPEHTLMVLISAGRLADSTLAARKITHAQHDMLMIAAAYHDAIHENGEDNEEQSAELAARRMRMLGIFSQAEIDQVKRIIAATKVKSIVNNRIEQSASPDDYLTMLMADADLSSFGLPRSEYWASAQRFFAETNPGTKLEGKVHITFIKDQIQVVGNHRYYTAEARRLFDCQPENVGFLQGLLSGEQ